jgi:hypothetical protein
MLCYRPLQNPLSPPGKADHPIRLLQFLGRTQPMRPFHSTKLKEAYEVHHRTLLQTKENSAFPLVIICFDFGPQKLVAQQVAENANKIK